MKRSLQNVCLLFFMLLVVKITKSDHNALYRLTRAVHGRTHNASLYNADTSRYNNRQQPNGTWSQPNNPGGRYAPGYLDNPNHPPQGGRPQNQYGYSTDPPNRHYSKQPAWNATGPQWTNPSPGGNNNHGDIGFRPDRPSGYNSDPNRNHYQPSSYSSTSPPWNNPGGNYNQGQGNSQIYPSLVGGRPQNTLSYTRNSTRPQGNQHYVAPNDLMIQNYRRKRAANNGPYETSMYPNSQGSTRDDTKPNQNCTNPAECYKSYYNDYYKDYNDQYKDYYTNYYKNYYDQARKNFGRHQNNGGPPGYHDHGNENGHSSETDNTKIERTSTAVPVHETDLNGPNAGEII